MQNRLFRKSALERLTSPEQLDSLMEVTQPRGWLALGTIVLLFLGLGLWAATNLSQITINSQGGLYPNDEGTLDAILYLRPVDTQEIKPGMKVQLAPASISPQEYGYLLGEVERVDVQPAQSTDAANIVPGEPAYAIYVKLITDDTTPTGYAWSFGQGPDITLRAPQAVTGSIILREERPISRIFPVFE